MTALEADNELPGRPPGGDPGHDPAAGAPEPGAPPRVSRLRLALVATDLVTTSSAWLVWALVASEAGAGSRGYLRSAVLAVVLTMASLAALHLYRARINSVRPVEVVGLARATIASGVLLQAGKGAADITVEAAELAFGVVASFLALVLARRFFRTWLGHRRRSGRNLRPVVVVGTDQEGLALVAMLSRNPEAGYEVIGVLGDPDGVANSGSVPWLGPVTGASEVLREHNANGAFVAVSALTPAELNQTVREVMADGYHVHLSNALRGIASRRIRLQPISREMVFYLEPARLRRWEEQVKRVIDVVLAGFGLVVLSPVLLVAALAIRLHDGGPALFRQERIGRGGEPFTLFKLRTMVLDAESRLDELKHRNERDGVLFKLDDDPRITRVGRLLRATSLDELPQLINVVRGEMSLVGPRPALPSEVDHFDERLRSRHQVTPGVTGLWQVDARDVPGLGAYTRLDLFYVENWSVSLDLTIIASTISHVLGRALRLARRGAGDSHDDLRPGQSDQGERTRGG